MSLKIPFSFNNSDKEDLDKLVSLLGYTGIYGAYPKAVKFSITLANKLIENLDKAIPELKHAELDLLFSSIKNLREVRAKKELAKELREKADKVIPSPTPKPVEGYTDAEKRA